MTDSEREELTELRSAHHLSSLGDRPHSIAAHKLQRLIELESLERADEERVYMSMFSDTHVGDD